MTRTARSPRPALHRLAATYGVQTAYQDGEQRRRAVREEALRAVLRALGAPVESESDIEDAVRDRRLDDLQRVVPPVSIVWRGDDAAITLTVRVDRVDRPIDCLLRLEDGETRRWRTARDDLDALETIEAEGRSFVRLALPLPEPLPPGYHGIRIEQDGDHADGRIVAAPRRAYEGGRVDGGGDRAWGVFLPLYALRSRNGWGAGDVSDLAALSRWTVRHGGDFVATLPLLPTFIGPAAAGGRRDGGAPFEPSPYSPVSRRFWNELYADVLRAPGLGSCPSAQMLLNSTALRSALDRLDAEPLVDYRAVMRIKRQVLEALADCCFDGASRWTDEVRRFVAERPELERYAGFRATMDRRAEPWTEWPEPLRSGRLEAADRDPRGERWYLYAQWLLERQMTAIAGAADDDGAGLYLDLPLGVHPDGFDAWRHPDLFARGASAGAPPDAFFAAGQSWGSPPLVPQAMRRGGYDYTIACLRHHMRHAEILRLDHVMSLHRLFWVPSGFDPSDGAYVRYPAEELYAVVCLESHRNATLVVGEDLGTVPREVRRGMARHGINGTYALQFEMGPDHTPRRPHRRSAAVIGTHDMPTFAAFWTGHDIEARIEAGVLDEAGAEKAAEERQRLRDDLSAFLRRQGHLPEDEASAGTVLRACLAWLAASPARLVVVNLEDLWLETESQNVPGTTTERPNWRRRARHRLGELSEMPDLLRTLETIDRLRSEGTEPS